MKYNQLYYQMITAFAGVGSALIWALGGWDTALQALLTFMAIDYITGILIALVWKKSTKTGTGTFESGQSVKGLFRKMMVLVLIYISVMLDNLLGCAPITRTAVILFFIANDGFSILENLGIMGVPYPAVIKNAFTALKPKEPTLQTPSNNSEK